MSNMKVHSLVLGMIATNVYLIKNEENGQIIIVDPADSFERIVAGIQQIQGTPAAILLTHGHFDHIGAADRLKEHYGIPMYACEAEREVLEDPGLNLSVMYSGSVSAHPDHWLQHEERTVIAGFTMITYHTPGHTEGGACYYFPECGALFSGDTLFCESYGRTDFPTGSAAVLTSSVKMLLDNLPEQTVVYPGHEHYTTIAHEKRYNPLAF